MTTIHFPADGYQLAGTLVPAAKPRNLAFLFIQGWTGHQNVRAAQRLAGLGFTCMTYDMRGNGESEGNLADFSRADFISDAVVAYDYFKKQLGEDTRIGVVGSSFGSYTAIELSKRREVYCLSMRVPANYPDEGFTEPLLPHIESPALRSWREKKLEWAQNNTLRTLHGFTGKVQIIEAGADERVAHQTVQNYADAVTDKRMLSYSVMKGAPHSLVNDTLRDEYEDLLAKWTEEL